MNLFYHQKSQHYHRLLKKQNQFLRTKNLFKEVLKIQGFQCQYLAITFNCFVFFHCPSLRHARCTVVNIYEPHSMYIIISHNKCVYHMFLLILEQRYIQRYIRSFWQFKWHLVKQFPAFPAWQKCSVYFEGLNRFKLVVPPYNHLHGINLLCGNYVL